VQANKIKLLPEHIIDQIKAGEVVERPSSLLKELIENSIDAKAEHIFIDIKNGGLDLIAIEDDGLGISYEDLPWAFCRHATSKISHFEDLYSLYSFGFRGEALASIASVSKVTCETIPQDQAVSGGILVIEGGEQKLLKEIPSAKTEDNEKNHGTKIFVKDLFFNTPVRFKYLASEKNEHRAIMRTIYSFIISNPQITFSLKIDEEEKELYPRVDDGGVEKRLRKIFFKNRPLPIWSTKQQYEEYSLSMYLSESNSGKANPLIQYIFVNGRLITDIRIHKTIYNSLEKYWGSSSGAYVIFLEAAPSHIDVNIHPQKTQIKFFKTSLVLSLIHAAIKKLVEEKIFSSSFVDRPPLPNHQPASNLSSCSNSNLNSTNAPPPTNHSSVQVGEGLCLSLSSNYSLINFIKNPSSFFLINKERFIDFYLNTLLSDKLPLSENYILPMIIGIPFDLTSDISNVALVTLRDHGFDLDAMDDRSYILRSIPIFLRHTDYHSMLEETIHHLQGVEQKEAYMIIHTAISHLLGETDMGLLVELIDSTVYNLLLQKNVMIELNENEIDNFFYRKKS